MDAPGDMLLRHLSGALSSVVVAAPFIKSEVLARLLDAVRPEVEVHCYTRWRLKELLAGVSDLDVWPLLRERRGSLRLCYELHAKVFRADSACLVGSANLTAAALGWRPASNLEVLVDVPESHPALVELFRQLDCRSIPVTDEIYSEMALLVSTSPALAVGAGDPDIGSLSGWLPRCRVPGNHNLYRTYRKQWDVVSSTTYEDAASDIMALGIPHGIESESIFNRSVAVLLRQCPAVTLIAERASEPVGSIEGQSLLVGWFGHGNGANGEVTGEEWATLRTWITTFLAGEFRERQGERGPELLRSSRIA